MLVSISKAHTLTGVARSTIYKDIEDGTLSFELNSRNKKVIQVSELERVYGLKTNNSKTIEKSDNVVSVVKRPEEGGKATKNQSDQLAVLQERIKALSSANDEKEKFITDMKEERTKTRNLFENQMSDMKDALSEAQSGYKEITKLIENKSNTKSNDDQDYLKEMVLTMKKEMEEQKAETLKKEEARRKALRKRQEQEKQKQEEEEAEKNKGFFGKIFG